jgi:hypothetical protein
VQEVASIEHTEAVPPSEWTRQIEEIDRSITNAQQVLRDLAASRMNLSISRAELAGVEEFDPVAGFRESRQHLAALEAQAGRLDQLARSVNSAEQCVCGTRSATLSTLVESVREQIWLLCQSLSRQQSVHEQHLLQSQRRGVDRCELELTRQIQHLRSRREELLRSPSHVPAERLHWRSPIESRYCECAGHEDFAARQSRLETNSIRTEHVVREKTLIISAARPGDESLARSLSERHSQLRRQWLAAGSRLRGARLELEQLQPRDEDILLERTIQTLREEHACIEQELSDAREQWQSLALLQSILQRTQQELNAEIPAAVVSEASNYLSRMTEGRYPRFRFKATGTELRVQSSSGAELSASALSRGTLEQAILCFRLALCAELARRGLDVPLILDDVLADSDSRRLTAAVDVLVEFAQSHQVMFLTCQEHLLALFASRDAAIGTLPGSALPDLTAPHQSLPEGDAPLAEANHQDRVQPDDPFWLQPHSPLQLLPSLGEQMSRRLGALGIRNVKELVELDPEVADIPLESLQISAAALRLWQAEGKLLCCIPYLTGRDAQILVACGIYSPAEMAERSPADLLQRVRRLRQQEQSEYSFPWLKEHPDWPGMETAERWAGRARDARTWLAACEQEPIRKFRSRRKLRHQHSHQPNQQTRTATIRLHGASGSPSKTGDWRFYLQLDSPVVDAPSIGPRTAERLNAIGVVQVVHLLERMATELASQLNRKDITEEVVTAWQWQASLMCRVPQLRGHDAQVLTHCGIFDPESLAAIEPDDLYRRVRPFVRTKAGQRLLRSTKTPDLAEITDWINWARQTQLTRAA